MFTLFNLKHREQIIAQVCLKTFSIDQNFLLPKYFFYMIFALSFPTPVFLLSSRHYLIVVPSIHSSIPFPFLL